MLMEFQTGGRQLKSEIEYKTYIKFAILQIIKDRKREEKIQYLYFLF